MNTPDHHKPLTITIAGTKYSGYYDEKKKAFFVQKQGTSKYIEVTAFVTNWEYVK